MVKEGEESDVCGKGREVKEKEEKRKRRKKLKCEVESEWRKGRK